MGKIYLIPQQSFIKMLMIILMMFKIFLRRLATDVAGGFMLEAGIGYIAGTGGIGSILGGGALAAGGFALMDYGNNLDKDMNNLYNWVGFATSVGLAATPGTNLAKIPIKVSTNPKFVKGVLWYTTGVINTGISTVTSSSKSGLEELFGPWRIV